MHDQLDFEMLSNVSLRGLTGQDITCRVHRDNNVHSGRPKLYETELSGGIRLRLTLGDSIDMATVSTITRATGLDGNEESQLIRPEIDPQDLSSEEQIVNHASTPVESFIWTELRELNSEQSKQEILQTLRTIQEERKSHVNRHITSRPPPSSPPQYTAAGSFSTPTIPALHQNSVPILIEHYRGERELSPDNFDRGTQLIHKSLLQAKIARGGSPPLLQNEYTAELASRLDAETVSKWTERRKEEEEEEMTYLEIESEDHDAINPTHTHTVPSITLPFHLSAHADQPISSGSISHQTSETTKVTPEGNRIFTRRTVIEICESVELACDGLTDQHSDQNADDSPVGQSHHGSDMNMEPRETEAQKRRKLEESYIKSLDSMSKIWEEVSRVD